MFDNKIQGNGNFNFNILEKKRKQPDSKVLPESVVALLSVTQQYRQNIKGLEDELEAIKKEEAQIHETFRRKLLQNQQRLKEFQNSEPSKRKTFDQEYQKNIEELHRKYKNQLEDRTVCKKCYNRVIPSSQLCIGCQMPVCKSCQEDPISWGCCHFNVEVTTSHMDIDKNENNKKLTLNMNSIHDTQVNRSPKEICCKDCIISLLPKRCEKCFKRLCQNKDHNICTICSSSSVSNDKTTINKIGNTNRMILLCDICQEAVHQYQNSLRNKDNNKMSLKYTYINDAFLFNECANPSCRVRLCKSCTEKEGASCFKCQRVYCSHCQKKNRFIKIVMDSSKNDQHSHWECNSCEKESQIKVNNENLKQEISNNSSNNEIEKDKKDMMNTDEHLFPPQEKEIGHQEEISDPTNDSNMTITETETTTIMAASNTNTSISENHTQNVDTANTSNTTSNTTIVITSTTTTTTTTSSNENHNNQKQENDITSNISEKNDKSTEELIFLNDKENIPLRKNNTKKKIKEIEEKLNSQSRSKYFNKIMKIRPELKSHQNEFTSLQNNNNNESLSNEQMNLDKSNKTENVTVKPLEKALSHVSLE